MMHEFTSSHAHMEEVTVSVMSVLFQIEREKGREEGMGRRNRGRQGRTEKVMGGKLVQTTFNFQHN